MDQHSPSPLRSRRAHAVPAPPALRARRSAVAAWALEHHHPVDRDALAVVVGLTSATGSTAASAGEPAWTADRVDDLLWSGVTEWCRSRGVRFPAPDRVLSTLTTYLAWLRAHDALAPGSASHAHLRRAVAAHRRERGAGTTPVPHGRLASPATHRAQPASSSSPPRRLASVTPIA